MLLQRLQQLEQRLNQLEGRGGAPAAGAAPGPSAQAAPATLDTQAILDRLDQLDQRITSLETNTVLSEPKTIVKQVQQYVDQNGDVFDQPGPGRREITTFQRERVFRRQTVGEAIQDALAEQSASGVSLGVSSVTALQVTPQLAGPPTKANDHVFGVSQADVTFLAKSTALNTSFFADLVGIGGSPPDKEIPALTPLNNQTARLTNNAINVREAWLRTEFGANQQFQVTVGQLDLTNYFDRNAVANDETSEFISGALVNNPVLGLINNGLGAVAVYDPKSDFNFKIGVQQSTPGATSLSQGLFSLAEAEYLATPFGLPEGHYRLWGRLDNSAGSDKFGWGVSIDQKINPTMTLFGRYGSGYLGSFFDIYGRADTRFFSGGVGFQAPFALNPLDQWGIGYAQTEIRGGPREKVAEGFYNLHLTEHLQLSAMLQYVLESNIAAQYFIAGTRMKVAF